VELKFPKTELECLDRVLWNVKNEEQTQEVKLTDAMPDVGKVLGAWGQTMIRSKEWRGSGMGISGGIMAWVLYQPEDNSEPRSVETWIPFQMRWEFPQTQRDGSMRVCCMLRSVDARSTSARKLMVRAVVSAAAEALEPVRKELCSPENVPEDVQLLRRSYPVQLPKEAGEKNFTFDEELSIPASCGQVRKLLFCTLQPELVDRKVMGDKVVFRGGILLHGMVQCEDGSLKGVDFEVPFSQYAELNREYDSYATTDVMLTNTGLEAELQEDGKLRIKAGVVGQYVIYDQPVIEVVEDAYSVARAVALQTQPLQLSAVLDTQQQTLHVRKPVEADNGTVLDVAFHGGQPERHREDQEVALEMAGSFQVLTTDDTGALQTRSLRWEESTLVAAAADTELLAYGRQTGKAHCTDGEAQGSLCLELTAVGKTQFPMVCGLELGELKQPDPARPSLILCRAGEESLWDMAKRCGSTVEAIREANGLQDGPEAQSLLLIPVL